jgi:toxin HigB-1
MIRSWRSRELDAIFKGRIPKGFPPDLVSRTRRLLAQLNAAQSIDDLAAPPGNRLHRLQGDLAGRWSVSVNAQFRITFEWRDGEAYDVWFGDYH